MENGPYRAGRPTGQSADEANDLILDDQPSRPRRTSSHSHRARQPDNNNKLKLAVAAVLVVAVILLGVFGWLLMNRGKAEMGIDGGKYQAVFFTNGQVYFGKLSAFNDQYMKLTDVFYLQTKAAEEETDSKNPQKTTTDSSQNGVELIKLGSEIHGPNDEMILSKDQILFFENLKSDGKVTASIDQYNKTNKK